MHTVAVSSNRHTDTHRHTNTYTHTHIHTHANTHTQTHTRKHTRKHTHTHTALNKSSAAQRHVARDCVFTTCTCLPPQTCALKLMVSAPTGVCQITQQERVAESHGQIVGVPTPQIKDEIAAIQLIPQERISERILEQTRRCSSPSDSRTKCRNLEDHPTGLGSAAHGGADCWHSTARTQGACSQRRCGGKSPCEVAGSVIRRL